MDHLPLGEAINLLHQAARLQAATVECIQRAQDLLEDHLAQRNGQGVQPDTGLPLVDPHTLAVRWKGETCPLGATIPMRLLERLCRRPNCFVAHEDLLHDVWHAVKSPNTVRSTIRRLKRQLANGGMDELARAIRCAGGRYALMLT